MISTRLSSVAVLLLAASVFASPSFAAEQAEVPADINPDYHAELAAVHMRYGELEKAIEKYTRAVELSGEEVSPDIAVGLFAAHLTAGRIDDADFVFEIPLATMRTGHAQYMVSIAKLYQEHGQYERAEILLKRAQAMVARQQEELMVIQQLLSLYRTTPLKRRQIAENEQRLAENPEDAEALRTLMDLYFYSMKFDQATEMAKRYAALRPDDVSALTELVLHYVTSGELKQAIEVCEQLIELDKNRPDTHYARIIQAYSHLEDLQAVDHWAQRIADDGIVSAEVYVSLAMAYAKAGRVEEAIEHYRRAVEFRPDDHNIHFSYASMLVRYKRNDEALEVLERIENTNDERLRTRVQQLLLRLYRARVN